MNVDKAKRLRTGQKAFVEKTIENVEAILTEHEGNLTPLSEKLMGSKSVLNEKHETIRKLDDVILESAKARDVDKDIQDSGEFCERVYSILAKIHLSLEDAKNGRHVQTPGIQENNNAGNTESAKVKLPKLELKSFSGNYQEWQSFWDTFESSVNRNTGISRIEKFIYLKSCVTSSAESAIAGLPLTADNYEIAINILKDRFGNPQLLISNYMDALLKLPAVYSVYETKKICELYDKIEIKIRSLNTLGIESESFGNLLVPIIMEKIPTELRLIISRKFGSEATWNLNTLLNALKTELEARERCNAVKTSGPTNNAPKFEQHKGRGKLSASALHTGSEQFSLRCIFCKKDQKSINCMNITEPHARRAILRRSGRCFVCLKAGHIVANCQSRARCFNCESKHHVAICENPQDTPQSNNSLPEVVPPSRSESSQEKIRDVGTSTMHIGSNNNSVLLQTAQAFVYRPDDEEFGLNTHVIFESCSQTSYITSKTREQLNLPTIGKETLLIKTFGDNSASVKECDIVQLCVRTIDGMSIYVTAYVVPVICSPVSNQEIQGTVEHYAYLQGLQLACVDKHSNTVSVDLLIGADHYWSFFTGSIIKGDPSGPVALETKLGWVLSGPAACPAPVESCTVNLISTHVLKIESSDISDMRNDLQKFWVLETLGIKENESSKVFGPSLNECLHTGPSLNPLLLDILLRFRVHEVAVTADIEKAFLNIEINSEHRDFLTFLWVDDVNKETPEVKLLRFARVVFGVNSSPFILNATIRHHINTCMPDKSTFARNLLKSLYVDDYLSGASDVNGAVTLSKESKLCLKSGGFNIREWNSNSESLLESLEQDSAFSGDFTKSSVEGVEGEDESFSKSVFKQSTENEQKVLGMLWNHTQDKLIYDLSKTLGDVDAQPATKRLILSTASRFFDPLGLISPVILPFKIMFQKLCKAERDWDELVDAELNRQWLSSLSDLRQAGRVSFNRCYAKGLNGSEVKSVQLHCFADASEKAYGAAVYMRVEYESKVECQLVASKTRVAPLAKQSIPRLELLANLTASRLLKSVSQALEDVVRVDDKFNWTDSMISLWWIINTDKEYKQFVEIRVSEIRRNAPSAQWKYCSTKENPADIASRGITATELKGSNLWLHGPEFLSKNSEHWPVQPAKIQAREELCELKSAKPVVSSLVNMCTKGEETEEKANLENIIKPENFSSVTKLIRVTALVLLFVEKLQKRKSGDTDGEESVRIYNKLKPGGLNTFSVES